MSAASSCAMYPLRCLSLLYTSPLRTQSLPIIKTYVFIGTSLRGAGGLLRGVFRCDVALTLTTSSPVQPFPILVLFHAIMAERQFLSR